MQDSSPTPSGSSPPSPGAESSFSRLSALERAAQRGIGPLSPLGMKAWHGETSPCVSCGELVHRAQMHCPHCGQDLSLAMITKMQAHSGPWYVLEHVRPFPGVTLERLIRQARRGILAKTTIVRGPTTYHQWRFAAETPGLSKYLGVCWNCQGRVTPESTYCGACDVHLDRVPGEMPEPTPIQRAPVASDLAQLHQALRAAPLPGGPLAEEPSRFPVVAAIVAIVVVSVAALIVVVNIREKSRSAPPAAPAATSSPAEPSPAPPGE